MGQLSKRVGQLREDLKRLLNAPSPTQLEIDRLRDRVADLLLRALSDDRHHLTKDLGILQHRAALDQQGVLYRDKAPAGTNRQAGTLAPNPLRHLFMPHPGAGDFQARALWPLQLLLQTASRSPTHGARLAERLGLSLQSMLGAADEAARGSSVASWSPHQYVHLLEDAAGNLDSADPPLAFRLDGRDFTRRNGTKLRLSQQEADFLRLLVDHVGQPVPHEKFRSARISYPANVKERLLRRLREADITLSIAPVAGTYTLAAAED